MENCESPHVVAPSSLSSTLPFRVSCWYMSSSTGDGDAGDNEGEFEEEEDDEETVKDVVSLILGQAGNVAPGPEVAGVCGVWSLWSVHC